MDRLSNRLADLDAGEAIVGRPAVAADGSVFAVRADGRVVRWSQGEPSGRTFVSDFGAPVRAVAFDADLRRVAVLTPGDEVLAIDLATMARLDVPPLPVGSSEAAITWDDVGRLVTIRADLLGTWEDGGGWRVLRSEPLYGANARFAEFQPIPGSDRVLATVVVGRHSELCALEIATGRVAARHVHPEFPTTAAVSPDGRQIAVGYLHRTVRLLDAESFEERAVAGSHLGQVTDVAWSSDGALLGSVGLDETARLWGITEPAPPLAMQVPAASHVSFSPDTDRLYCVAAPQGDDAVGAPNRIQRWNLSDSGSRVLRGHDSYVYDVVWSPDGERLASIDYERDDTRIWDADTGALVRHLDIGSPLAFRDDGALVLDAPSQFVIADPDRGSLERRPRTPEPVLSHAMGGYGSFMGGRLEEVDHAIWRTDYSGTPGRGFVFRAFRDGAFLASMEEGDHPPRRPDSVPHPIFIGDFAAAGSRGFTGFLSELIVLDGAISEADADAVERYLETRRTSGTAAWPALATATRAAHFVAGPEHVTIDAEGLVRTWSAVNDPRIVLRRYGRGPVRLDSAAMRGHPSIAFGEGGEFTRLCGQMECVLPADIQLGDTTVYWLGHYTSGISSSISYVIGLPGLLAPSRLDELRSEVAANPSIGRLGNTMVVNADGLVASTNAVDPSHVVLTDETGFRGRIPGAFQCVAFHPDGRRLAAGTSSGTIEIWDVATLERVDTIVGHQGSVFGVHYSPDGQRLVSGGNDTAVRVWDVERGAQVIELRGHDQYVKAVAFSPDGSRIASASGDRTVRIWGSSSSAGGSRVGLAEPVDD